MEREEIRAWLDTTDAIRSTCDLDLLGFLTRHPHTLLTTEQIANFVGYSASATSEALEHLLAAGLATRLRGRAPDVDLYILTGGRGSGGSAVSLFSLLEFASTRDGRLAVIDALRPLLTAKGVKNGGA